MPKISILVSIDAIYINIAYIFMHQSYFPHTQFPLVT